MSKIRELIESEICNKISDVKIIDSQNEISGCDDDFSLSYKDKIIEVFF